MNQILDCTGYEILLNDIEKAEGYYLFDSKGTKYTDFESGVWSISIGHNNLQINQVIKQQIDKIIHLGFRYTNKLVEIAAMDLIRTLEPFHGKCLFLSSGSEAVELSVKIAKAIIKDKKMLTFKETYLSAYGMSSNKDVNNWITFELSKCRNCINYNCENCKLINEIPFDEINAFIFEPGNTSGLVLIPPQSLIKEISKRLKENNGIVVVDEVTTGVGRTGKWYGFQHFDIKPDIVAIGKGIGNGYPVSAVVVDNKIAEKIYNENIRHSQSHQNDALGCAIVSEVIRIIEQNNLIKRSEENGKYFINKLCELKAKTKVIKEVRGTGMMIAIEFEKDAEALLKLLDKHLIEKGYIIGYKPLFNLMRFYPSLTTKIEDIDRLIDCIEKFILKNSI